MSYPTYLPGWQSIAEEICDEIARAEKKHPNWPKDVIKAAAIVSEENGELIRAAVQFDMEGGSIEAVRKEAIETAAMCIRLLKNLPGKIEPVRLKASVNGCDTVIELTDTMTVREAIKVALLQTKMVNNTDREFTMHAPGGHQIHPDLIARLAAPVQSFVIISAPVGVGG
jgi:hypothetical protein